MTLERLWAGWRREFVETGPPPGRCVFCRILASDAPPESTLVVWRDERVAAVLNAYPYTSGHLLMMPVRHLAGVEELDAGEGSALWTLLTDAVRAVQAAYRPDGLNLGANLGRAGGAGIPGHLHLHCVPRWDGDTNFMTTAAETRVLPEALPASFAKIRKAWPADR